MDTFLYTIQNTSTGELTSVYLTEEEASRCAVDFNFAMGVINRQIESVTAISDEFTNQNMQQQQINNMEGTAQPPPDEFTNQNMQQQQINNMEGTAQPPPDEFTNQNMQQQQINNMEGTAQPPPDEFTNQNMQQQQINNMEGTAQPPPVSETMPNVELPENPKEIAETEGNFKWSDETILTMLTIYEENLTIFDGHKITKKKAWKKVAAEMRKSNVHVTGDQCSTRMRLLLNKFKQVKDHNSKTGNSPRNWKFYDRMDSIFGRNAWARPLSIVTSEPGPSTLDRENIEGSSMSQSPARPLKRKRKEEMLEEKNNILKEIERNRQRRHEEKMEMDGKFLKIFQEYLAKK